jgi:hypothetical protein
MNKIAKNLLAVVAAAALSMPFISAAAVAVQTLDEVSITTLPPNSQKTEIKEAMAPLNLVGVQPFAGNQKCVVGLGSTREGRTVVLILMMENPFLNLLP